MTKTKNKRQSQRVRHPTPTTATTSEIPHVSDMAVDDSYGMLPTKSSKFDVDADARSVITNKMLRDFNLKKKDKQKLKHNMWKKKVNTVVEAHIREAKGKKRRQIAQVVGDMSAMLESLPIEVLLNKATSQANSRPKRKAKSIESESFRQQQKLSDISLFRSVLYHPEFKSNPIQTVTEHLRNKIERECNETV